MPPENKIERRLVGAQALQRRLLNEERVIYGDAADCPGREALAVVDFGKNVNSVLSGSIGTINLKTAE